MSEINIFFSILLIVKWHNYFINKMFVFHHHYIPPVQYLNSPQLGTTAFGQYVLVVLNINLLFIKNRKCSFLSFVFFRTGYKYYSCALLNWAYYLVIIFLFVYLWQYNYYLAGHLKKYNFKNDNIFFLQHPLSVIIIILVSLTSYAPYKHIYIFNKNSIFYTLLLPIR